jgi:hypothetical protein
LHSDNGAPMKSVTLLSKLYDLGACRTFYPFRALKVSATIGALPLGVLADEPLRPC